MGVHPQAQALLDQMATLGVTGLNEMPIDQARTIVSGIAQMAGNPEDVAATQELAIARPSGNGAIRARLYRPTSESSLPAVVWFHGGGWALGDMEIDDANCRALANRARAVVVNVDYRLAPEDPFPAGADDCLAATRWVQDHTDELAIDPRRIAVAGESSGGNLAAVTALRMRDNDGRPALCFQLLVSAALDSTMSTESYQTYADGHFLTRDLMAWAWNQYCPGGLSQPQVSPMHAENLEGLPPALIVEAECDPLRDEGVVYARRLREAGVNAEVIEYPGMVHGFFGMPALFDTARKAVDDAAAALRRAFSVTEVVDLPLEWLRRLAQLDIGSVLELLAEDAVLEMPLAPPGLPSRIEGRDAIAGFLGGHQVFSRLAFHDVDIHTTDDPELAVIEFRSEGEFAATGKAYQNRYALVMRVRAGRIVQYREYFNPMALAGAFPS
jgi:acetyl esterase